MIETHFFWVLLAWAVIGFIFQVAVAVKSDSRTPNTRKQAVLFAICGPFVWLFIVVAGIYYSAAFLVEAVVDWVNE